MSNLPLAFLLGLLGSLHCAVMCGPLMLSLPILQQNRFLYALQLLLYQAGRVSVYTFLGVLVGLVGNSIVLFTSQETLSLVVGILLMVFAFITFSGRYFKTLNNFQLPWISTFSRIFSKLYGTTYWGFFAGILNGLLPCGMVYMALATALNSSSIKHAANFMFLFGLGTTPLMLLISLGKVYLKKYIRFQPTRLVPWFMLFLGALFILRSADLGIPFFSPNHHLSPNGHATECR